MIDSHSGPREADPLPPTLGPLLALAPLHITNRRGGRYSGDDLFVPMESLAERDRSLLKALYKALTELLYGLAASSTDDAGKWREVDRWTQRRDLTVFIDEVRELGVASHVQGASEIAAKAVHDVRGGALNALLGRLQMIDRLPRGQEQLKTLFVLTRDHLKIMRNALLGLDEPRREADRTPRSHHMRLMLEKWHNSVIGPMSRDRSIQMSIDCRYDGNLTECCLESAAIDRIFYNLASNACRHAAGDRIELAIFPIPDEAGDCLRFVLSNQVGDADAVYLRTLAPMEGADAAMDPPPEGACDLRSLFEPTVSSTGSGFGLTVVADFVASAFGLRNRDDALRQRYVGALLDGNTYRAWFHWPKATDALPPKLDDYRRPKESLSEP